ncbi:MAG: LiaI-LiaF-like domain-containing protein [Candidatus Acidiferrales bacterium]
MRSLTRGARGMIFGMIVVIAGVTLLLDQMNLVDATRVFRFWPLALIAWGVSTLLTCHGSGRRFWGGFLILAGIGLQLQELGYQRVRIETLWPLFIIGVGVLLVMQAFGRGDEPLLNKWQSKGYQTGQKFDATDSHVSCTSIFGAGEHQVSSKTFQSGEMTSIFGGGEIDFTQADIEGEQAVLEATMIFGGGEIRVPRTWNVVIDGVGIFGGYSDKTTHPPADPPAKKLIIRGIAVFGGMEIKN